MDLLASLPSLIVDLTAGVPPGPWDVVFCRNVMIYFDRALQNRVHQLFYESLPMYGILALGSKETLRFSDVESRYEEVNAREKIYRKVT